MTACCLRRRHDPATARMSSHRAVRELESSTQKGEERTGVGIKRLERRIGRKVCEHDLADR